MKRYESLNSHLLLNTHIHALVTPDWPNQSYFPARPGFIQGAGGGAENARMEKARLENTGTSFFLESQACLLVWFADA